jgi:GNAT superfamily N-acetyltransferase
VSLAQTAREITAQASARLRAVDPLLPPFEPGPAHCGANLVVTEPGRAAAGWCEHWTAGPGSLDPSWGAARRFQLSAAVAGPDVTGGLSLLLDLWRGHLADQPHTAEADTAAVVNWPSRDAGGIAPLLRHGLAPLEVLAVRTARRPADPGSPVAVPPTRPNGPVLGPGGAYRIRRAGPADLDVVARLGIEIIRFDAQWGTVNERPDTLTALRDEVAGLLDGPEPWAWLAERDGEPAAMVAGQRPDTAAWVAPLVRAAPAAYLMLMYVNPAERGSGVAGALADEFHRAAGVAGAAVSLLHYEQLNPLSVPFWSRQGYRPLWTTWQVSPAGSLR